MSIPSTWAEARLGDISSINPKRRPLVDPEIVSFVPMSAVDEITGEIVAAVDKNIGSVGKGFVRFEEGDVLFAKITPSMENGKSAVARDLTNGVGYGSTEFFVIRPHQNIIADYVWYFVRRKTFRQAAALTMSGAVGQQRVPLSFLSRSSIPFPTTEHQIAIVDRLRAGLQQAENVRTTLFELLPALKKLRTRLIDETFQRELGDAPLHELGDLTESGRSITYGIVQTGTHYPGGIKTVRAGDIRGFTVEQDGLKEVREDIERSYPRTRLQGGEVLISIRGTVGNVAVAPSSLAGGNVSREVAVIPLVPTVDPKFCMYYLAASPAQDILRAHIRGVAQRGINLEDLRKLAVPVPQIERQRDTVARLTARLALVDVVEQKIESSLKLADIVKEELLEAAFSGRLVSDFESEATGHELLSQIKAAQADADANPPSPRLGRAMKKDKKNLSLIEILKSSKIAISPEDLFARAGFDGDKDVERFFDELKKAISSGAAIQTENKLLRASE